MHVAEIFTKVNISFLLFKGGVNMKEIIENNIIVEDMIYEVRGVQVMLSSDVAKLYQVETKVSNQTIKRNINRFPSSFCFQLNDEEIEQLSLRSQFATLNILPVSTET